MTYTFSITSPNPTVSLSLSAKKNIAEAALASYFSEYDNLEQATSFLSSFIIEQEIGFSGSDVAPDLFTELVAQITDTIYEKLSELANK
jgi:hypothetical protein